MKQKSEITKHRDPENTRHGGGKRHNRSDRKDQRRVDAEIRQEARDERGDEAQLAALIADGRSSCREALRLTDAVARYKERAA